MLKMIKSKILEIFYEIELKKLLICAKKIKKIKN